MKMLSPLVRLPNSYLIIFCLFVSIYGKKEVSDLFPPSEVGLMVRRGTTWKSAPNVSLTLNCPAKHGGKSLNITWCKLLDSFPCQQIYKSGNVDIRQNNTENGLISNLIFKRISIHDDGLYRCEFREIGVFSHTINISVSDMYEGVEKTEKNNIEVASLDAAGSGAVSWLPYFYICFSIVLLFLMITAFTWLCFYGWKCKPANKASKRQEMSSHMIPDLPKASAPSTPVLQVRFVWNEANPPSTSGSQPSAPSLFSSGSQPCESTGVSHTAVYTSINHTVSGMPARKEEVKDTEYAAIKVS
ncbi:B- and T-lymphocyte attenuator isoform X4 [Echeneis naucrates]|uniref:B- and T-lymphocyte attenuator isoform X4 n=1 Tax=Echeneis naucrates TaxID=173247 RepID=UPI0011141FFB|nr:cell surface glycoprotein CD200 receptor 1 isoform X4 [Echeneis naucrates]